MFKNFKKNDKYFTIALYAFVVVALLIALIFACINLGEINAAIKGFFGAIAAFMVLSWLIYVIHYMRNWTNTHSNLLKMVSQDRN